MNQSETIEKLAEALAKAQGQIKNAEKDSTNPHFKSKYADLASVWSACREALSSHGLSVIQTSGGGPDTVRITTRLLHESGQWLEDSLELKPQQCTPQGIGSAVTYGKRYSLMGMVGIAPDDDDDGQAASQPIQQTHQAQRQQPVQAASEGHPEKKPIGPTAVITVQAQKSAVTQPFDTMPETEVTVKKALLEQITNLAKISKLDKIQTLKVLGVSPATASVDELDAGKSNLTAFNNRFINKQLTDDDKLILGWVAAAS